MEAALIAIILEVAALENVDGKLLVEIARQESRFDASAVGASGELGLFQIMPATWEMMKGGDWTDAAESAKVAARYWNWLSRAFPEANTWQKLIMWNAGHAWYKNGSSPPQSAVEFASQIYARYIGA